MLAQERYDAISKILDQKNAIKVSEVMKLCNVSHETARRDLEIMQEIGIARRVHGGAVLIPPNPTAANASPAQRPHRRLHAGNIAVARAAAKLVRPGDSILLDNGRTLGHMAHCLKDMADLTVITPSMFVISELSDSDTQVLVLGGELSHEENCLTGKTTENNLRQYNIDKAFIGCAGLSLSQGFITEYDTYGISRQLIRELSTKMILVVNSEKLKMKALANIFHLSGIDTIVVDERIQPEEQEAIVNLGIELIIAPMPDDIDPDSDE